MLMKFLKFEVWSSSNGFAEIESWFPKQHDSLALTEWLVTLEWSNDENGEFWPLYLCHDYERFKPESWLQAAFHSRLVHRFVAIGLEKMRICFENCGVIVSPSDCEIVARTHAYSFQDWWFSILNWWWVWILIFKTIRVLDQINRVRDIWIGQRLIRKSFLILISADQLTQLCFQPIDRLDRRFLKL